MPCSKKVEKYWPRTSLPPDLKQEDRESKKIKEGTKKMIKESKQEQGLIILVM